MQKLIGMLVRTLRLIRKIGHKVDEQISAYALYLAVIVSAVIGWLLRREGVGMQEILAVIGCILAASFALIQWDSGRRVKRAELLNNLINKLAQVKSNLKAKEGSNLESDDEDINKVDEKVVDQLIFLSYIAYLGEMCVLSGSEFNALRLDLISIMENGRFHDLIISACKDGRKGLFIPYEYLVSYGASHCNATFAKDYKALLRGDNVMPSENQKPDHVIDEVSCSKWYRNHLEVLNGIFMFGYRAHMRGSAELPDGSLVWFPKYYNEGSECLINSKNATKWINILDEKGNLLEYWPKGDEIKKERVEKLKGKTRYAFGMNLEEQDKGYKFLGVYQYKESKEDHAVYERIETKLTYELVDKVLGRTDANS